MWNTILFDLDGTLTDSQEGIVNSVKNALDYFGIQEEREKMTRFVGPPLHDTFREVYSFTPEQIDIGTKKFREYFNEKGWLENAPYPGVEELLQALQAAGKHLVVATSKPEMFAVRILEHFGLAQYFDHICGAPMNEQAGAKKSQVIENALSYYEYSCWKADAVMVGDRKHDILGAHEKGLPAIGVLYGYGDRQELEEAGAEFIAEDLAALQKLLLADVDIAARWVRAFDRAHVLKNGWGFTGVFRAPNRFLAGEAAKEAFEALDYDTAIIFREGRVWGRPRVEQPGITAKVSASWVAKEAWYGCDVYITDRDFRWTYVESHELGWLGPYFCKTDDIGRDG